MRIISKFHDYYDSAQAQGQDRSLVFVRTHEQYPLLDDGQRPAHLQDLHVRLRAMCPSNIEVGQSKSREYLRVRASFGVILFAGRLYPMAEVVQSPRGGVGLSYSPETAFVYTLPELDALLKPHGYDIDERKGTRSFLRRSGRKVESFFKLAGSTELSDWATLHRLPIVSQVMTMQGMEVCPQLSKLEFFRVLDTWQAYQELSMFLGNIAAPDLTPVTVADKDRIQQHGFDKWSFRRPPQADRP